MIIDNYEPKNVFSFFEEICAIPHGSRNTKKISDYLVDFAKERNLEFIQDDYNNVIIKKPASEGYEGKEPVIIQGHIDMVCEKEAGVDIDFLNEGLRLAVDDDFICAEGTTLGGDDGIAVAYALALLDSDAPMRALEAVFTVDEEIGMLGAAAIDLSPLKGKILLNIDSENEGELTVSCAGGATSGIHIPVNREAFTGNGYKIIVSGLQGGHSGVEIDKGRANANKLMGEILAGIKGNFRLAELKGGLKDNAIPRECEALICSDEAIDFAGITEEAIKIWKYREPEISVSVSVESGAFMALTAESTENIINALNEAPNGVQKMSSDIEGLVQTSLNLGIMELTDDEFNMILSVRSSVSAEKQELKNQLESIAEKAGGSYSEEGNYPAWEYRKDSPLRDTMVSVYKELYGKEPIVLAIHAGLECGILSAKIPGLDCVSFGPDIFDIHTPKEKLSISSTERTWKYLLRVLEIL